LGSHARQGEAKMSQTNTVCAGIDVGKAWLDVATSGELQSARVSNDAAGIEVLAAWLAERGVERVGLEASGGYERLVARRLRAAGLDVRLFQPMQVKAFARFSLRRAKSDPLDAALIAECTALAKAEAPPARSEDLEALAERLRGLEQIEEDLVRAKTRREGFRLPELKARQEQEIARLKALRRAEIKALLAEVQALPEQAHRLSLLLSIPGVGPRTALAMLLLMPELGQLSREQAASLAGLAPFDDRSGKRIGQQHIQGGRARLRASLYAAALPAAFQWNPALVSLYKRLMAKGKSHKAALVACARKLIIFANTVLQRRTPWVAENVSA
jgi:transposase